MPGVEKDDPEDPFNTGVTVSQWVAGEGGPPLRGPDGLPIFKPPYNRVSAYDMNKGERIWWQPIGEVDPKIKAHPALQGVDLSRAGGGRDAILMVTKSLLLTSEELNGKPVLSARDKTTGERLASIGLPAPAQYGMMTYMHENRQYIVVQIGGAAYPGSLVSFRLPSDEPAPPRPH
jgi:quinoprotein glucose dehydrogenase